MKFRPLSILLLGFAVAVVALSYGLFFHYMPNMEEKKDYEDYKAQLDDVISKEKQAVKRVLDARKQVEASMAAWSAIVNTRTPSTRLSDGGINLGVTAWQLPVDARIYRNSVQKMINKQLQVGGVKLPNGGPFIAPLGEDQSEVLASLNYPAYAFPVAIYELAGITVEGTYDQIMANYQGWGRVDRYIAMPDGLTIAGTSPKLTATYNVIVLGFIRAKEIYPPAPDAVLAGGANAGPGARGGGGFPTAGIPTSPGAGVGGGRFGGGGGGRVKGGG